MKRLRLLIPLLLIGILVQCNSSRIPSSTPTTSVVEQPAFAGNISSNAYPSFLSNYAMLFVETLSKEVDLCNIPSNYIPSENLIRQFPIDIMRDSIFCVSGFLEVNSGFYIDTLKSLGIYFIQGKVPFSTAVIPLRSLCSLLKMKGIKRFELSRKADLLLNVARPAVNAQTLLTPTGQGKAYTGKGIIIGVVDYGFDYGHPTFYDTSGTTLRISRLWEQQNNSGNPPSAFGYGSEMTTQEAILAAGTDTELETHGTHVAGIAGGCGAGTEYYGLAPECELVFVSTNRTDAGISDGLKYIADYAESVGKPCVINFSLGSNIGPHDGTSSFDRLCENQVRPGMIFVGAAGNDGNQPIYISSEFQSGSQDSVLQTAMLSNGKSGDMIADFWGAPGTHFGTTVYLYDTVRQKVIANAPYYYTLADTQKIHTFELTASPTSGYVVQIASEISPYNGKPTMLVQINLENADSSAIPVVAVTSQDGFVEGWCSYGIFSNLNLAQLESGSTNNTINEIGGTGKKIISVGAFCTKNTWYTLDSLPYHYGQQAVLGEIADFSAKGPTADGRIKPDIACPGYGVVSSFSRYFDGAYPPPYYRVQAVPFGNQSYCFGILQGTSEATPIVSGTIALWMQENPSLTTEEALHIIRSTAIPSPGMSSPNNYWGWGILNAGAGMKQVINALSYEAK